MTAVASRTMTPHEPLLYEVFLAEKGIDRRSATACRINPVEYLDWRIRKQEVLMRRSLNQQSFHIPKIGPDAGGRLRRSGGNSNKGSLQMAELSPELQGKTNE